MGLYLSHAKQLRSPDSAIFHAVRIGPWIENYRASEARQAAAEIVADMSGEYAVGTINRSLGALTKALSIAYDRNIIPHNYGASVKRLTDNTARDVTLSIKEVEKLADAATEQTRAAIWIALYTGCRRAEILSMCKADISGDAITIRASNTKTLKTRTIPIAQPLRPWLNYIPLQMNFEGLKTGFRRAREKAGIPHVRFHDLRRSCGTIMVQSGVDIYVVSKLLGHSSIAVTQKHYAHLQIDKLREGLNKAFPTQEITQTRKRRA
jgi:integrase